MTKKKTTEILPQGRWMTECDVVRYNLKMPHELKEQLKKEALKLGMDTGTYVCGLLAGDIKRKKVGKRG